LTERSRVRAVLGRIPNSNGKTLTALDGRRQRRLANCRLDHLLDVTHTDPEARGRSTVDLDGAGEVVGGGVTVNVDPEAFKIIDGKLYLIYDVGNADDFAAHADANIPKADANWPQVAANLELDKYH